MANGFGLKPFSFLKHTQALKGIVSADLNLPTWPSKTHPWREPCYPLPHDSKPPEACKTGWETARPCVPQREGFRAGKNEWKKKAIKLAITENCRVSLVAQLVKNSPANAGDATDTDLISRSGRSPWEGKGNLFQHSWLENFMDREAWKATVRGDAKS